MSSLDRSLRDQLRDRERVVIEGEGKPGESGARFSNFSGHLSIPTVLHTGMETAHCLVLLFRDLSLLGSAPLKAWN